MYGKLFTQMYDGTLGTKGPWQALVTFQQMIVLADQHGEIDMTPEAMARRTTIPIEIIVEGIKALEQPDPDSRSPALQGRRIERLTADRDWGWRIVNYAHYRSIRTQDDRREYMKQYQRERRAKVKKSTVSTSGKQNQPIAEAKAETSKERAGRGTRLPPAWQPSPDLQAWARAKRQDLDLEDTLERFRDHWAAQPGQRGVKLDWAATYRNWVRREKPPTLYAGARGGAMADGARPTILCRTCGKRVSLWTDGRCDPCWRKDQGLEVRP